MNHDELARLPPVPADRDLPADRKQILKEHLMTELRRANRNQEDRNQEDRDTFRARHPRRIVAIDAPGKFDERIAVLLGNNL